MGGYLATLMWVRERDCPWDKYTCQFAAFALYQNEGKVAQKSMITGHLVSPRPHLVEKERPLKISATTGLLCPLGSSLGNG